MSTRFLLGYLVRCSSSLFFILLLLLLMVPIVLVVGGYGLLTMTADNTTAFPS